MHKWTRSLLTLSAASFLAGGLATGIQPAQAQTAAEKLYADLAKMPAEARDKAILEGAKKEGTFVYIQTITGKNGQNHSALFAKRYPFLNAQVTTSVDSQVGAERLVTEEKAGRHLTDALSAGVPDLAQVVGDKVYAVYHTPYTDRFLPQYKSMIDPEGKYTPWYWSEHGVSYNANLVKGDDIPRKWEDLCNPALKGQVSYEPEEVRFQVGLWQILDQDMKKVEALFKCIGENKPVLQRGHTARMTLMLAGDHWVGGDQYFFNGEVLRRRAPDKNPFAIAYDVPIMAYAGAVTINKNTPHPYAAALYVDWTLQEDSQEYMANLMRGPLTIKHPYLPSSAPIVSFGYVDTKITDELHELWLKNVGRGG